MTVGQSTHAEYSGGSGAEIAGADHALIVDAISGDEAALRRLWNTHRRWVAAVLLAHMPRDVELDDLLQEVAVAVVAKLSGVREPGAFKPWLRAVAISIAKTSARRRQVRKAGWLKIALSKGTDEPSDLDEPRRAALKEGRRLMDLCTELPDGYREPLLLKCVQGMSYREIGRVMGLPETTVETRIARGRRMLRQRAEGAGLGPSPMPRATGESDDEYEAAGSLRVAAGDRA